jgi:hypothetical protein
VRPVNRPGWRQALASHAATLALQNAFGRYCSICERFLPEGGVAWNAATGDLYYGSANASTWPELLVLCVVCAAAATESASHPGNVPLALPDRELTFTLAGTSLFQYELCTLVLRTAEGVAEPMSVERVVVHATTPSAAETVRRFALNTGFYQAGELVAPAGEPPQSVEADDWRLIDRTRAWQEAERAADNLRRSPAARDRDLLAGTVGRIIECQGCWSVWATVLWERLRDPALLARLLLPRRGAQAGLTASATDQPFPATRVDALPRPEGTEYG